MITSEVHDNKTTLATKGDLVEESVVNSASEGESDPHPPPSLVSPRRWHAY